MLDARGDVDSSAAMKVKGVSGRDAARHLTPNSRETGLTFRPQLNRLVSQTTLNQRLGRDQRTSGFCASTLMAVAAKVGFLCGRVESKKKKYKASNTHQAPSQTQTAQLEHKLSHVVLPTVNNSGLAYVDLRLDEATGKLKPHEVCLHLRKKIGWRGLRIISGSQNRPPAQRLNLLLQVSVTRTFKLVDAKRVPFLQTTVLGDVEERIVRVVSVYCSPLVSQAAPSQMPFADSNRCCCL